MRLLATTFLAAVLLNAGAFTSDNRAYLRAKIAADTNITVLTKNQAWPVKSQMKIEPCSLDGCVGV
ncbi:MAG: hypothetical protein ACOZAM_05115 [Pseudomonadota bacterium]